MYIGYNWEQIDKRIKKNLETMQQVAQEVAIDLTGHLIVNKDLSTGSIDKEGYDLISNADNNIFKLTKNGDVLVLSKETSSPTIDLSTLYYEKQKYYVVKFSIRTDKMVNISGLNIVDENALNKAIETFGKNLKTINGQSIMGAGDITIAGGINAKQISLFGNKSILVPNDFPSANIDLFTHNFHITGTPTATTFDLYFEVLSSKNTPVDSLQDMKLLMGDNFTHSCSGVAKTKKVKCIAGVNGIIKARCDDGTEELLTGIAIEDDVKTV